MTDILKFVSDNLALIVSTGVSIIALIKWGKYLIKPIYNLLPFVKHIKELEQSHEEIKILLSDLKKSNTEILFELKPNAGHSMRDAVNMLGDAVARISARSKIMEDQLPFASFGADENGRFVHVNYTLCEWSGREESELLGFNWQNTIHTDDQDGVKKQLLASIFDIREMDINFRFTHTNGECFKVRCIAKPTFNGSKLVAYSGTIKKL